MGSWEGTFPMPWIVLGRSEKGFNGGSSSMGLGGGVVCVFFFISFVFPLADVYVFLVRRMVSLFKVIMCDDT